MEHAHCHRCGAPIVLVKVGTTAKGYKWVTNPKRPRDTWKCGNDPAFPVRTHAPRRAA